MRYVLLVSMLLLMMFAGATYVFTTQPVRKVEVQNSDLVLWHYYDYRADAKALTYFARVERGAPTGKLYGVELRGQRELSRRPIVQFSDTGAQDSNPGTLVTTVPTDSPEAASYEKQFSEVRELERNYRWWKRVSLFH